MFTPEKRLRRLKMDKKAKMEFLLWAIPCMENPEIYSDEKREYKKKVWPKIKEKSYNALKTGEISEGELKYWYVAYPHVIEFFKKGIKSPMKEYLFTKHNELVVKISKIDNKILPCLALVGIVKETNSKTIVDVLGKSKICTSKIKCNVGDYVGIHINTVVEKLEKESFLKYKGLLEKYKQYI